LLGVKSMRDSWASAVGIEIENKRMLGKRTLFVYDYPLPSIIFVEHVYFTEKFLCLHGYRAALDLLGKVDLTLELAISMLPDVPKELKQCHYVVSMEVRGLNKYIKKSDTVRLLLDDYHTASVTLADMLITEPADYKGDEVGELKK